MHRLLAAQLRAALHLPNERAAGNGTASKAGEADHERGGLPLPERRARREAWAEHILGLDVLQAVIEDLRVAAHVQQAVALPVNIGELGDDVAGDLRVQPHLLDLPLERE